MKLVDKLYRSINLIKTKNRPIKFKHIVRNQWVLAYTDNG